MFVPGHAQRLAVQKIAVVIGPFCQSAPRYSPTTDELQRRRRDARAADGGNGSYQIDLKMENNQ